MKININSYSYGNAAADANCAKGPVVLKKALEKAGFSNLNWQLDLKASRDTHQKAALNDVASLCEQLAKSTQQSILNKHFFITLGGDHSCAIGTWSGAMSAISHQGDLGLIWIDAHMDAHTVKTSLTQNIHGMPLSALLGDGEEKLTHILSDYPKIKPENLVLIGIRSFEIEEEMLLKKLGVKIFYMSDIFRMGLEKVITEAINIVTKNTVNFGVSLDIDALDPIDAPGTGTTEKNGIRAQDFLNCFHLISDNPKLIGLEIAEFNPIKDKNNMTADIIVELVKNIGEL